MQLWLHLGSHVRARVRDRVPAVRAAAGGKFVALVQLGRADLADPMRALEDGAVLGRHRLAAADDALGLEQRVLLLALNLPTKAQQRSAKRDKTKHGCAKDDCGVLQNV